jgi:DNA invertase Pin-like site-specific DNA recombinase
MTTIGYASVSTTDQDLDIQVAALKREGCTTIRSEKRSGTSTANRAELRTVLDFLRKGDVLIVTRIDRLAAARDSFVKLVALAVRPPPPRA